MVGLTRRNPVVSGLIAIQKSTSGCDVVYRYLSSSASSSA